MASPTPEEINDIRNAYLGILKDINQTISKFPENMNAGLSDISSHIRKIQALEVNTNLTNPQGNDDINKDMGKVCKELEGVVKKVLEDNIKLKDSLKNASKQVEQVEAKIKRSGPTG